MFHSETSLATDRYVSFFGAVDLLLTQTVRLILTVAPRTSARKGQCNEISHFIQVPHIGTSGLLFFSFLEVDKEYLEATKT